MDFDWQLTIMMLLCIRLCLEAASVILNSNVALIHIMLTASTWQCNVHTRDVDCN